ncbi:MAG: hypothetical protein C3F08_10625 [Candidatus Methylomirabilota bacterium]|nr:MAG: hypothetical protein C3F08_10625 [candidate division NC10 bacterium]
MQRLQDRSVIRLRFTPLVAAAVTLYLFLNAFLILCLTHPHMQYAQHQAKSPLVSVCLWLHKAVSPHAPSTDAPLPVVAAMLLILLPLPQRASQFQVIRRTGRSPPRLCFA